MPGNNFNINCVSDEKEHFENAFAIAFSNTPGGFATNYRITEEFGLIFYWDKGESSTPPLKLPYALDSESACNFAWNWLKQIKYPSEPDHDGSNEKGFIITTGDFWGHIENNFYSIVAVKPDWQMYGK